MKALSYVIFIFYSVSIFSVKECNSYAIKESVEPTPSPLGKSCDVKLGKAMTESRDTEIEKCNQNIFNDWFEGKVSIIEMVATQTDCCSFWSFFKCLERFEPTYCTSEEKAAWDDFVKRFVTFLEINRCEHLPFNSSKCDVATNEEHLL
jgi:hypothetical protein